MDIVFLISANSWLREEGVHFLMVSQPGSSVIGTLLHLFPAHLWTRPASQLDFQFAKIKVDSLVFLGSLSLLDVHDILLDV